MSPKVKAAIKKYWPFAVVAVIIAAVIILLTSLFQKNRSNDDYYKQLLAAKDETIKVLQTQRNDLKQMHATVMAYAQESDRRDSVLLVRLMEHQKKYESVNKSYAQIPDRISKLANNVDSLLAAFRDY